MVKVSTEEYGINPLYCITLPAYTYHCALKYTDIKLQALQDKDLILFQEKNISGGLSAVMGDRYVKTDENEKIIFMDPIDIYGHSTSQILHFDEIERWHGHADLYMNWLEGILNTPDDSDFSYFVEVDLKYPEIKKERQRIFHFVRKKYNPEKIKPLCEKKIKP